MWKSLLFYTGQKSGRSVILSFANEFISMYINLTAIKYLGKLSYSVPRHYLLNSIFTGSQLKDCKDSDKKVLNIVIHISTYLSLS